MRRREGGSLKSIRAGRPIPMWIGFAAAACAFGSLWWLERRRPLRRATESRLDRNARNLAVAACGAVVTSLAERPATTDNRQPILEESMESKAKLLGHGIHPILIVFPLGLLATAVIFDVVYLVTKDATMATVSYWMIVSGVIGGLVAALFGWIDWFAIPQGTRAKRAGADT